MQFAENYKIRGRKMPHISMKIRFCKEGKMLQCLPPDSYDKNFKKP